MGLLVLQNLAQTAEETHETLPKAAALQPGAQVQRVLELAPV